MAKSNKSLVILLTLLLTTALFAVAGSVLWFGLRSIQGDNQSPQPESSDRANLSPVSAPLTFSSLNDVPLNSDRGVNYTQLRESLRRRDWQAADRETYLRMLDAAGAKAQAAGMTPEEEMKTLSCTDLRTIDQLWSTATTGKQGFSVQMQIFRALGSNYRKLYDKVGWQTLPPSNQWAFEWDYNPQTKRMQFKPDKEPNYTSPLPGHLPTVEIGYNLDVAFSGALRRCGF
jgi:hypothetical protein